MQLQFAAEHFTNISLNLQDALSDCIPGGGVDQHGGGCQGAADEGGAAAQLRGHGHDPHEHRTQGGAHMEHGGVVWWLQIKYDNKNK